MEKDLENFNVINKAVCLQNGSTDFYICKNCGASSILEFKPTDVLIQHWGENRQDIHYSGEKYIVDTIRLDTFIEENGLEKEQIDFIHIDAQGVDLECLISLGKYINNVVEGVVETVINKEKGIYINQSLNTLENIEKFLKEKPYFKRYSKLYLNL